MLENCVFPVHNPPVSLHVLIAPDKFKGTLTALEAAKAIARGWRAVRPEDQLTQLPISDGGDGFGPLIANPLNALPITIPSKDAAGNEIEALIWQTVDHLTLIESANLIGMTILTEEQLSPFAFDSSGLGLALQSDRIQNGSHCIIGIGGSATNDGGFGMAKTLGWHFLDGDDQEINHWPDLVQLKKIIKPNFSKGYLCNLKSITVAVDVQNPLLGPNGCTRIYGPQKGLCEEDLPRAEAALTRLAEVWASQTGEDAAKLPGAGAAGGLGFGLHCFAGAEIRSGFDIFTETTGLEKILQEVDIVTTGEGTMDRQTVMGKGVGELAKMARAKDCRCLGMAGRLEDHLELNDHFEQCCALTEITSQEEAKQNAEQWLEKLAAETAGTISETGPM